MHWTMFTELQKFVKCLAQFTWQRVLVSRTLKFKFIALRSKHTCINYYKCITYFQHTSCSFVFDQNALADGESGDFNQRFYTYTSFRVSMIRLGVAICKLLVGSQQFMDVVSWLIFFYKLQFFFFKNIILYTRSKTRCMFYCFYQLLHLHKYHKISQIFMFCTFCTKTITIAHT